MFPLPSSSDSGFQTQRSRRVTRLRAIIALVAAAVVLNAVGAFFCNAFVGVAITSGRTRSSESRVARFAVSTFGATAVGSANGLQQLRGISAVIPDEFSFEGFDDVGAKLALVTSRTLAEALNKGQWPLLADLVEQALHNEQCAIEWDITERGQNCFEESLYALVGKELLTRLPEMAKVSTELPASAQSSPEEALRSARRLLVLYEDLGVSSGRVMFRVPASHSGLRAAEALAGEGLQVHLTHVYSVEQALLGKEAGVTAVQVYVDRVTRAGGDGVALAREIYKLLSGDVAGKRLGGKTPALIAASLQRLNEVYMLAGVDYLLVPPRLLRELQEMPDLPTEPTVDMDTASKAQGGEEAEAAGGSSRPTMRSFLCPPDAFEAALPESARRLLSAGLEKNSREHIELRGILARAREFL